MIKFVKLKTAVFMLHFAAILCCPALYAQNYFAGAGAGTGNTGNLVTAVGNTALHSNNSGNAVTAVGSYALFKNTTGYSNTAVGHAALYFNQNGNLNTATGTQTLYKNTSGGANTATGYNALFANTSGDHNTAVGNYSLKQNESGTYNTAIGSFSLESNYMGDDNTAIGVFALRNNINGSSNTGIGHYGLSGNKTGWFNTAVGNRALSSNVNGGYNVAIGASAGGSYASIFHCTFLGVNTDATSTGLTNATAIGYNAKVDASYKVVIGNTAITSIGGQVGWTTYSDQSLKTNINKSKLGLDFIMALNPVTYNYKAEGQKDIEYTGLIAQEVDAAAQKAGIVFSGVDKSGEAWGIRYAELTVPLIKAVQESAAENLELKKRIEKLENLMQKMQQNYTSTFIENKNNTSTLFQNHPNPFNQSTVIQYDLAATNQNTSIVIRSINGSIVKQVALKQMGKGKITITAGELAAGTYTYSLLINDAVADTKLMVITR
jgi:trimeric autotransporter adhesin